MVGGESYGGGVVINADALNWYIRESVFDHIDPQDVGELMIEDGLDDDRLKRLFGQRAAQQLRLDSLVDDYATALLSRAEFSAWKTHADTGWRRALIDMAVERIDVFPGIRKPLVNVDGVTMRFDKDRVRITWHIDTRAVTSAA